MNLLDFVSNFPDEASCRNDLRAKREASGIVCSRCGGKRLNWLNARYQWHCNDCKYRMTVRSGTIMHDSKLPVRTWYLCAAIMTMTKKAISAHEMQRQLGMKRYEPVWAMMHKIRRAMAQRDSRYLLEGTIELDETQFNQPKKKGVQLKHGMGSQRKKGALVMAESTPLNEPNSQGWESHCRYFKIKVLDQQKAAFIDQHVKAGVHPKAIVISDRSNRYAGIHRLVEGHVTVKSDAETTNTTLKWVHVAISNAKRTLLGVYHCVNVKYLQAYLDEFCYKLNRRYFGKQLFDRLLYALATSLCKQAD